MSLAPTLFKYGCSCGNIDFFRLDRNEALCNHCDTRYTVSPTGVILFDRQQSEQTEYFDNIYGAGQAHAKDKFQEQNEGPFKDCAQRAEAHLRLCGMDTTRPLKGLSFLDVACGAGWLTAGLMQIKSISDSRLHAFDVSSNGLNLLAGYMKGLKSSNHLELSLQHAEKMRFGDGTFDVIIGSSFLHHLDDYETFLKACRRIVKPDGVALFGEPFAIGYGLGAAALLLAQRDLGTHYHEIEDFYADIVNRGEQSKGSIEESCG